MNHLKLSLFNIKNVIYKIKLYKTNVNYIYFSNRIFFFLINNNKLTNSKLFHLVFIIFVILINTGLYLKYTKNYIYKQIYSKLYNENHTTLITVNNLICLNTFQI